MDPIQGSDVPVPPPSPVGAPQKSHKGLIITLLVLLVGLPILGMLGFMGLGYWQMKKTGNENFNSENFLGKPESSVSFDTGAKNSSCSPLKSAVNLKGGTLSSADWPSDLPEYPNATTLTAAGNAKIAMIDYCVEDSFDTVVTYFMENGKDWGISTYSEGTDRVGKANTVLQGKKGERNLTITINDLGGLVLYKISIISR